MNERAILRFDRVSKRYPGAPRPSLEDVSFEVPAGMVTGLVGPNGSGKTSLLELAAGLRRPSSGTITVLDRNPWRHPLGPSRVGVVMAPHPFVSTLSASSNIDYLATHFRLSTSAKAVLAAAGLPASRRRFSQLSLGEQLRLRIAWMASAQPELVLLDEPFNGLDPDGIGWLTAMVDSWRTGGVTVVLSSHLLDMMEGVTDGLIALKDGKVVLDARRDEVAARRFTGAVRVELLAADHARGRTILDEEFGAVEEVGSCLQVLAHSPRIVTATLVERSIIPSQVFRVQRALSEIYREVSRHGNSAGHDA